MWRKLALGLCVAMLLPFVLAAFANLHAKDLGPSIKTPDNGKATLEYKGHFVIKMTDGNGMSGTFDCLCKDRRGTCEVTSVVNGDERMLVCQKGKTGTCRNGCSMHTSGDTP